MMHCRKILFTGIFRMNRQVFHGGPGGGPGESGLPSDQEIGALEREAAKVKPPEDKLLKSEEAKVDDLHKIIEEKEAAGRKLNPDTQAAYKAFKEKHGRYEDLLKAETGVSENRKDLVKYLRDILIKGGTDKALVAAYRKEAGEQKVVEEKRRQETAKTAAAESADSTAIMANLADFKLNFIPKLFAHAKAVAERQPPQVKNNIMLLASGLNQMNYDEVSLQKLMAGTESEKARDAYDIKNTQDRAARANTRIFNEYRQLNQVLATVGGSPMHYNETAYTQPAAPAQAPKAAPKPAPAAPPAPKPAPARKPEAPKAPPVQPDLVARAPAPAPAEQAKPAQKPAPAVAQKPADPAKPAATPPAAVAGRKQPDTRTSPRAAQDVSTTPGAQEGTQPSKPAEKQTAPPGRQEAKNKTTDKSVKPEEGGGFIDANNGLRYFATYDSFKAFLKTKMGNTMNSTGSRDRLDGITYGGVGQAMQSVRDNLSYYRAHPNEEIKLNITFPYREFDANNNIVEVRMETQIVIPKAYTSLNKPANTRASDILNNTPNIKFYLAGGGTQRGNETTLEDTNIVSKK